MDKYTASNGVVVSLGVPGDSGGVALYGIPFGGPRLGGDEARALREFFQAERDEELGRWRWPENPDYVVYRSDFDPTYLYVLDEKSADIYGLNGIDDPKAATDAMPAAVIRAADAFREAHPERKPWHDAKPGEVWELVYEQLGEPKQTRAFTVDSLGHLRNTSGVRMGSLNITDGRRIWPEAS